MCLVPSQGGSCGAEAEALFGVEATSGRHGFQLVHHISHQGNLQALILQSFTTSDHFPPFTKPYISISNLFDFYF
jgi:hypothetical protein